MTPQQTTSARPIHAVQPLSQRGDEHPPEKAAGDFYELVKDTLAAMGVEEDIRQAAGALIQAAHDARMKALDVKRVQAERAASRYASMDRTNQSLLQDVKRMVGQLVHTNARQHAHEEALGKVRHDVRELIRHANEHQLEVVDVRKLETAVHLDVPPIPTHPVIVAMATDQRYGLGIFELADQPGRTVHRTFLGWSLVVEQPLTRTVPEPTFLDEDGTHKTQSQLHHSGLTLLRLA